ncbi:MAG: hypothetical protein EHM42_05560 [Planctomycetaceae bacterium]|nr:MAG: hypothetical protein EHM42_05560 [Planctomycetaceae bacterium]
MPSARDALQQLLIPTALLVGGLIVLAVAVHYLKSWWNERAEDAGEQPLLLSHYREMVRRGELSEEEYRKIMGRLAARMGVTPPGPDRPAALPPPPKGPEEDGD